MILDWTVHVHDSSVGNIQRTQVTNLLFMFIQNRSNWRNRENRMVFGCFDVDLAANNSGHFIGSPRTMLGFEKLWAGFLFLCLQATCSHRSNSDGQPCDRQIECRRVYLVVISSTISVIKCALRMKGMSNYFAAASFDVWCVLFLCPPRG